ncbi:MULTISPECIES: hypothetical protein [unclassified Streptomyces]|uniref:hypothetical protein n=1 Tax=unclassified Streptomyces TaxID=2593676 RepID=UPI0036691772
MRNVVAQIEHRQRLRELYSGGGSLLAAAERSRGVRRLHPAYVRQAVPAVGELCWINLETISASWTSA